MTIRNVKSVELGYQEWQHRAIPHIAWLAHSGGIDVDLKTPGLAVHRSTQGRSLLAEPWRA